MSWGTDDVIKGVVHSREHFLKHLKGISAEQWTWKPYPECNSIVETVAHLIADDRSALGTFMTGGEPDYAGSQELERDPEKLLKIFAAGHAELTAFLKAKYGSTPLETEVSVWGFPMKLGQAITFLSSEDYYHAGQIAFIRMATDPAWDYYAAIYEDFSLPG